MKALILTYYFPPSSATAGYRPFSWVKDSKKNGIECTVITRHWNNKNNSIAAVRETDLMPIKESNYEDYTLFSLPYKYTAKRYVGEVLLKHLSPLRKAYYFGLSMLGEVNIDMDSKSIFKNFILEHLKNNTYDVVIITAPPINIIWLGKMIYDLFKIPYVVDFRDLWNNDEMKKGFKYNFYDNLIFSAMKSKVSKWLESANLVTVASPPMKSIIKDLGFSGKVEVLLNGFEENLYDGKNQGGLSVNDKFNISCVGTLYPTQDIKLFCDGFNLFISKNPEAKVKINFIGASFIPGIKESIENNILPMYLNITERIDRGDAIQIIKEADLLYYPAWKEYEGILTTKIFDYIASGKNILIAPGDESSIDSLILQTNSGKIANTKEEIYNELQICYSQWVETGKIFYGGNKETISEYSREKQTKRFFKLVRETI